MCVVTFSLGVSKFLIDGFGYVVGTSSQCVFICVGVAFIFEAFVSFHVIVRLVSVVLHCDPSVYLRM